jgi:hypothetical protein
MPAPFARRILSSADYQPGPRRRVPCMGDSLTDNFSLGVRLDQSWPAVFEDELTALGCAVLCDNAGKNGNTTTQMLARVSRMTMYGRPSLAVVFGGVNDPGNGIAAATTTANLRAMVKYLRNGAAGTTATYVGLPTGSVAGTRYVVTSDTSTTGGLNPSAGSVAHPTVTGPAAGVRVWESRNTLGGEAGWSRVADLPAAERPVDRFILVGPQFLNYAVGGDTAAAGGSHAGQNATYLGVHNAVAAAATAEGVPYCDFYDFQQKRILAGLDAAASATWHVAPQDQHLSVYGEDLAARAVLQTLTAQAGWLEALS